MSALAFRTCVETIFLKQDLWPSGDKYPTAQPQEEGLTDHGRRPAGDRLTCTASCGALVVWDYSLINDESLCRHLDVGYKNDKE